MRIATVNVNGIRASVRRGFVDWLETRQPDLVALQEVRAPITEVPEVAHAGYHFAYHPGDRAGRNGVALLSRERPTAIREGFGSRFDAEGRYLEADYDLAGWRLTVASLYLPKGGRNDDTEAERARYQHKLAFLRAAGRIADRPGGPGPVQAVRAGRGGAGGGAEKGGRGRGDDR